MNCLLQAQGRETRALPKSFSNEFIRAQVQSASPTSNQKRWIRASEAFGRSVPLGNPVTPGSNRHFHD